MATMIPDLSEEALDDLRSAAEAKVYRAFRDQLPDDYVVFFQVGWILRREHQQARDGEADFMICQAAKGYVCIEVKGGGVGFDAVSGEWYSIDRNDFKHRIKDPVAQALRAKYSVLSKLNEHPRWGELRIRNVIRGHAAFFPDIGSAGAVARPDLPSRLIGTEPDLQHAGGWIEAVFDYWHNEDPGQEPLGARGLEVIRQVFGRSFEVRPLISSRLRQDERIRLRLTNDQLRVLDLLRSQRRAAISGGAGTGKTVLAVEKAKRLAGEGFYTLLTCYNRQLADHLGDLCGDVPNLDVMSFHQLCYRRIERSRQLSDRDVLQEAQITYPGADLYDVQYPNALAFSLEILPEQYDAIVCDEGQDFREEYWLPIELLLSNYDTSPLYIFFDDNQNLYSRVSTFPIRGELFSLTTNCRNTDQIHAAAYRYYRGEPVQPSGIDGAEVQFIEGPSLDQQAKRIHNRIVELIAKEGVQPADIAVLIVDARHKQELYSMLSRKPLPRPAVWLEEGVRSRNAVLLDTVQRFKGLESGIVFLWELTESLPRAHDELLYVGISRAKSVCYAVGQSSARGYFEGSAKQAG